MEYKCATEQNTHRFSRQILLDPFAEMVAATDGLNDVLAAAVAGGALEPHEGRRAVAFEMLGEGYVGKFLGGEGVERA